MNEYVELFNELFDARESHNQSLRESTSGLIALLGVESFSELMTNHFDVKSDDFNDYVSEHKEEYPLLYKTLKEEYPLLYKTFNEEETKKKNEVER